MVVRMNERELRKFVNTQPNDSKRHDALHDATERIRQLEQLNATLAAEIDRMRPVVEAVLAYTDSRRDPTKDRIALLHKIQYLAEHYEASRPK